MGLSEPVPVSTLNCWRFGKALRRKNIPGLFVSLPELGRILGMSHPPLTFRLEREEQRSSEGNVGFLQQQTRRESKKRVLCKVQREFCVQVL